MKNHIIQMMLAYTRYAAILSLLALSAGLVVVALIVPIANAFAFSSREAFL